MVEREEERKRWASERKAHRESNIYAVYNLRYECNTERAMWHLESGHGSGV
jgi:hypothetical protein